MDLLPCDIHVLIDICTRTHDSMRARAHGCARQEQDWGGAWLFYYGQDAIYVDPGALATILDQYAAAAL